MPAIVPGFAPGVGGIAVGCDVPMAIIEWSMPAVSRAGGGAADIVVVGTAARQVKSSACAAATARCRSSTSAPVPLAPDAVSTPGPAASTMASALRPAAAQAGFDGANAVTPGA